MENGDGEEGAEDGTGRYLTNAVEVDLDAALADEQGMSKLIRETGPAKRP